MADHGTFWWNELAATDVESAKQFYEKVVGWTFQEMPMPDGGTYWLLMAGDKRVGGLMAMPEMAPAGTPAYWMSYVAVDDVDTAVATAGAAGGTVLVEPFDIPNIGRMSVVRDPQGAVLSLVTSAIDD